jgi:hypothetical protein
MLAYTGFTVDFVKHILITQTSLAFLKSMNSWCTVSLHFHFSRACDEYKNLMSSWFDILSNSFPAPINMLFSV